MSALLNVIWLLFAGFWLALGYVLAGIVCCLLIITIPFGLAAFRIAGYALWPFGRTVTERAGAGIPSLLGNVLWVLVAGFWLAVMHIVTGIALCLTVVGIPLGLGNFKMVPVSLLPLGRAVVAVRD
ncbi:YccF domain-containing protein [Saccharomonospora saliphila]|uniref:YccF domain-containing protein n=1 Tax=Saccharomonospora saliphila TaxID=369829 RepID=UPI00036830C8|nr:YccF domain-containing protein [Saccharomonospora saliphila]